MLFDQTDATDQTTKNHEIKMPINPEITIKKIGSIFVLTSNANIMKTIIIAFRSKFIIN